MVGIDFGTSKCVIAFARGGTPTIVQDMLGRQSMPSVVLVTPDGRLHVGWDAASHPSRYEAEHFTIASIKRLMGRAGETGWGSFRTYPQEVSALILARLKLEAESYGGSAISDAVIAVPAHFDINQRWATAQAAEIAGLKLKRLVNEATASVLAYRRFRRGVRASRWCSISAVARSTCRSSVSAVRSARSWRPPATTGWVAMTLTRSSPGT